MADEETKTDDQAAPEQEAPTDDQVDQTASGPDKADDKGKATPTALDSADNDDKPTPADWPEDWRSKLAGEDEKALKQLERYKSPVDVAKALRAAQQKISSGEYKQALPDDASEEQVAEWRKANGIPEKPEGYLEALKSGVTVGEEDKPLVEGFLETVHGKNAPPEVVDAALNWYYETQEKQAAEMAESDKQAAVAAEDALRAEWGGEYRANVNAITNYLDALPETEGDQTLGELLKSARLGDGTPLFSHPAAVKWMADMANEANPAGFVAPGEGTGQIDSVETEIATIEKTMREKPKEYYKDERMQERYRKLLDARDKLNSRAA